MFVFAPRTIIHTVEVHERIPDVVAHRGHQRSFPENTLAAIGSALDCGAHAVEIDVHLTADGVPILLHDETLDRVCGVRGLVHRHTLSQLRGLRASERSRLGDRFPDESLATLRAGVELIDRHPDAMLFVELKKSAERAFSAPAVVERVLPALEPVRERCAVISFSPRMLREVRRRSDLAVGPVVRRWSRRTIVDRLDDGGRTPYLLCDLRGVPETGSLAIDDTRVVVYEVPDAALARTLGARGVDMVETFNVCEVIRGLAGVPDRGP